MKLSTRQHDKDPRFEVVQNGAQERRLWRRLGSRSGCGDGWAQVHSWFCLFLRQPCVSHMPSLWSRFSFKLSFTELGSCSCSATSDSLQAYGLWPARILCPWNSPGKNIGVGCCFLLQVIFPTQGSNPGLPHCRQILYHLSHRGSPYEEL